MGKIMHGGISYSGGGGSGGASAISDLADVELANLADGQILKYDATNQKWVNNNESGGTTVIANPSGTPTEELETIQIGEDIYEISGGGSSGSGYSRTNLWSGEQRGPMEVPLSDDINNYDSIEFVTKISSNGAYNTIIVDAKSFSTKYPYSASVSQNIPHYCLLAYDNLFGRVITGQTTSSLYIWDLSSTIRLAEVNGIKYETGGGSESRDKYSTEETVIGEWIDGKPIYRLVITPWINGTLQTGYTYANNILSVSPFNNRNVKDIVNCRLLSPRDGTSGGYTDVMVSNYSSASGNNDVIVPNTDGTIWIKSLSDGQNRSVIVILEYTKTTD